MSTYYMQLLEDPLRFPPVSKEINVFFDEGNKQVFAVAEENGFTHISVKGPNDRIETNFQLANKGHVISMKFSPDRRILAIQRSAKSVELINFTEGVDSKEYSQSCKGRASQIIGFCWTSVNEIVFVTNQGIEFYQVQADKYCFKLLKNYNVSVNWFVYLSETSVLLLSSGILGNVIHPYLFRPGSVVRLPKFEVENPPSTRTPQPMALLERDVTVASIYGLIYVVVLRNQPRSLNAVGAEIVLYQLQKDIPAKKTAVLRLGAVGRFAVNVVDNLIVVHHQASKTSMLFDIHLGGEFDGQVAHHYPVLSPLPIQPCTLVMENLSKDGKTFVRREITCDLYSMNWVVFQPNIIIDARLGCLWELTVKLESVVNMIEDKGKLIDFLLLRQDSKLVLLSVCNQMLVPGRQSNLTIIALIFDKMNAIYHDYLEACSEKTLPSAEQAARDSDDLHYWLKNQSVIDQSDMYTNVFSRFIESKSIGHKFMNSVLVEYIRSLNQHQIQVEYYLHELIINLLVKSNQFYQLHQFLQYHVLSDSKPLACLLLSLETVYPPAYQLSLDMMKRLGNANEEIVEVLLSKQLVIPALRFLQNIEAVDSASPRKFLEVSLNTGDNMTFYAVFKFFQLRNLRLRKQPGFAKGEQCELYERHFKKIFGEEKLENEVEGLVEIIEGLDF